jgi:hypothetical protein
VVVYLLHISYFISIEKVNYTRKEIRMSASVPKVSGFISSGRPAKTFRIFDGQNEIGSAPVKSICEKYSVSKSLVYARAREGLPLPNGLTVCADVPRADVPQEPGMSPRFGPAGYTIEQAWQIVMAAHPECGMTLRQAKNAIQKAKNIFMNNPKIRAIAHDYGVI